MTWRRRRRAGPLAPLAAFSLHSARRRCADPRDGMRDGARALLEPFSARTGDADRSPPWASPPLPVLFQCVTIRAPPRRPTLDASRLAGRLV